MPLCDHGVAADRRIGAAGCLPGGQQVLGDPTCRCVRIVGASGPGPGGVFGGDVQLYRVSGHVIHVSSECLVATRVHVQERIRVDVPGTERPRQDSVRRGSVSPTCAERPGRPRQPGTHCRDVGLVGGAVRHAHEIAAVFAMDADSRRSESGIGVAATAYSSSSSSQVLSTGSRMLDSLRPGQAKSPVPSRNDAPSEARVPPTSLVAHPSMRMAAGVSGHQRPFVGYEISAMDLIGVETRIFYLEQGRLNAAGGARTTEYGLHAGDWRNDRRRRLAKAHPGELELILYLSMNAAVPRSPDAV